jgi:hypothetical protein
MPGKERTFVSTFPSLPGVADPLYLPIAGEIILPVAPDIQNYH